MGATGAGKSTLVDRLIAALRAPRIDGMALLRRARQRDPEVVVVLLTEAASVERVDTGTKLVSEAGSTMDEIVSSVQRVTDIIAEISASRDLAA